MTIRRLLVALLLLSLAIAVPAQVAPDPALAKAEQLNKEEKFDEALAVYLQVLEKEPKNYRALYQAGWIYNDKKQYEKAAVCLKKATEVKPDSSMAFCEYAFSSALLNKPEVAQAAYEKALQIQPENAQAWFGLGDLHFQKKNFTAATNAYEKGLTFKSDSPNANWKLGWCYNDQQKPAQALPYLKKASELEPKMLGARTELAFAYLALKDYVHCAEACQAALGLNADSVLANYYLGLAYLGQNQLDKARAQATRLEKLDSEKAKQLRDKTAVTPGK